MVCSVGMFVALLALSTSAAPASCRHWLPRVAKFASPRACTSASTLGSTRAPESASALRQVELKRMAGYKAVDDFVMSGMVVGLGTGSTAAFAVERLGMKIKSGDLTNIIAIPTSVTKSKPSQRSFSWARHGHSAIFDLTA